MRSFVIYVEGGGHSTGQKRKLRAGFDAFFGELKEMARKRRWGWRLIPCGARQMAYEAFVNARDHAKDGEINILLVDSETPVTERTTAAHLQARPGEGWDLAGVPPDHVHLMVQTMETWVVADPEALARYYGPGFRANALPARPNLEEESKDAVARALDRATRQTQKGLYQKLMHGSELLKRIDAVKVQQRCRHCEQLFAFLAHAIVGD